MIRVYFAGSIRGGRRDAQRYGELIAFIATRARVLTEHVAAPHLSGMGENGLTDEEIFTRDMQWLAACDAVIAEVSTPSLGVGYEIARAVEMARPVLCLYDETGAFPLSAMIAGNPRIPLVRYRNLSQAKGAIDAFITEIGPG